MVDSTGCGAPRASYVKGGAANWRHNGMYVHDYMYSIPAPVFMFVSIYKLKCPQSCKNVRMLSVYFIPFVVFGNCAHRTIHLT